MSLSPGSGFPRNHQPWPHVLVVLSSEDDGFAQTTSTRSLPKKRPPSGGRSVVSHEPFSGSRHSARRSNTLPQDLVFAFRCRPAIPTPRPLDRFSSFEECSECLAGDGPARSSLRKLSQFLAIEPEGSRLSSTERRLGLHPEGLVPLRRLSRFGLRFLGPSGGESGSIPPLFYSASLFLNYF